MAIHALYKDRHAGRSVDKRNHKGEQILITLTPVFWVEAVKHGQAAASDRLAQLQGMLLRLQYVYRSPDSGGESAR